MALISRSWEKEWPAAWKLCSLRKKSLQPLAAAGVLPPWNLSKKLKLHVPLAHSQKEGVEDLRDFRPINLVGSVYKLLAKVLANRLKSVMREVIFDSQQAFVQGRQILDAVLIASETLDSRLKDNKPSLLLKMDIVKAFDHVNWDFLMEVMSKMGFGHRWINWMKWGCSTTTFSILINGNPSGFFRLKVNLSKTEAFPVGEGIPMKTLASVLGCKIGSLPTTYLGLPLGAPYKSTRVWDTVEERFRKRLEKIQRDFLWGGGALENKPHLVSWKVICAAKKNGGLGIRNLAIFNKALLGKWLWRFANENESLWKQIISSKYDLQNGGWCSKGVRDCYGVGVWKAIRNGWESFRSHSHFFVGDGTKVKFWKDLWCENQSLEEAFPTLFNLSVNKDSWVAEAWEEDGVGGSWAPRFNRHLNDWEVGEVESLLGKLLPMTIRRGVNDSLRWKENKNGTFSVKSFYSSLSKGIKIPFSARTIWTPWVPIRASFFGWRRLGVGCSPLIV
ncbi:putative ribonuclease H protein [Vitis vinifera]|uniref:Putative ribonuclease H protein n=1 Tax=Vitis vinifera TaxID=29760 RepID=A0A438I286_VITVI|nr:putative ribonuclease H protein [Vitis vinifera]